WPVAGDGGWDCLFADTLGRRLYLSHGTRVEVRDLLRGTVVGPIDSTAGAHDITVAHELRRGFITCGRDSSLLVFDLETLRPIQRVAVTGRNPDAILYEPVSRRLLTFNGGGSNATVVDAATGTVAGSIDLRGRPE